MATIGVVAHSGKTVGGGLEELRAAAVDAPALVLGPLTGGEWARVAAAGGDAAAWNPEGVAAARAAGIRGVHLKLDTGMGRLGARPDEIDGLVAEASRDPGRVAGLMTHFASADEREGPNAGFTREQAVRFRRITAHLAAAFPGALRHAANSAATLRDPELAFDAVRCGIALYGCCPFGGDPADHGLRPAMTITSRLASIKTLRSRDSAGYGRTWRAPRGTRVAVVPLGYADGYTRALGNRACVLAGGRRVPVVGAVSMDQITVDLGPESTDAVDDPVVVMGVMGGERVLAEELAHLSGTINYEVTCGIAARVTRVYD